MNPILVHEIVSVHQDFSDHSFPVFDKKDSENTVYKKPPINTLPPLVYWEQFFGYAELHKNNPRWNREFIDSLVEFNYELTLGFRTKHLFNEEEIEQNLLKIRQETEKIYETDNEIDKIDERAYSDIRLLLNTINKTNWHIPMPDLDWADDGSLNTTWIHRDDIITMGVYGNNVVHFTLYFQEKRQVSGVCEISDRSILNGFLQILDNILHE